MKRTRLCYCLLLLVAGCSGGPDLAPVSGRITLDGKPLADATVGFYPVGANTDVMSTGRTNSNGEYSLKTVMKNQPGAVVGQHRVSITVEPDLTGSDLPADQLGKVARPPKLPARYQGQESELNCNVPPGGKTDANFDLKSK
ncbi:MAG TPA: carboxypeptidase-like regulatory domain-containing protein [Gemmataceae bacterium]|nr:carboxypeptidase-like regulatory domain-containing protein [Gemmataceae bacterium]